MRPRAKTLQPDPGLTFLALAGLGFVTVLAYSNTVQATGFALDNQFLILQDPRLLGTGAENLKLIFTQDYWWPKSVSGLYRPLTTLSYLFNYSILGDRDVATGYHVVNLAVQWLNTALVYLLALRLVRVRWQAFFVAAIFGVHPITTEAVTNIIGRSDLLAAASVLGGTLLYAKSKTREGRARLPWLFALGFVAAIGVFCKESAVVVLPVLVLWDVVDFHLRAPVPNRIAALLADLWRNLRTGYVAVMPALLAIAWARAEIFAALPPPELRFVDNPLLGADFAMAKLTALKVIGKYIWLLLWPLRLSADYSYDQIALVRWPLNGWGDWQAVIAFGLVAGLAVHATRQLGRNPSYFFFVAFFFLTLLPTSNLVLPIGSIMAERFLYLPSIGFAGGLVLGMSALFRRLVPEGAPGRVRPSWEIASGVALALLVAAYGIRTFDRNSDWYDDRALWTHDVKVSPESFKTHMLLAFALYRQLPESGIARKEALVEGIEEAERAVAILEKRPLRPDQGATTAHMLLGELLRERGDLEAQSEAAGSLAAAEWYRRSVDVLARIVPVDRAFNESNRRMQVARGRLPAEVPDVGNHVLYWNLGASQLRLGNYEGALDGFHYMARLTPSNPDAYLGIASVHLATGSLDAAGVALLQTLLLDNKRADAFDLLSDVYQQADGGECAFADTAAGRSLDTGCPLVHEQMCRALAEMRVLLSGGALHEIAGNVTANAQNLGCPSA